MEMTVSGDIFKSAKPFEAVSVTHEFVERELLLQAFGNPFVNRLPTLVPLFILGLAAFGLPERDALLALVSLQLLLMVCTSYSANIVKSALADKAATIKGTGKAVPIWLFFEMLSGMLWGLMIGTTVGITNPASTTVSVTLIVTLALAVIVAASAPRLVQAMLIGFALTSIPTTIYYYDYFGVYVTMAVLLFSPTMFWLATRLGKQAHISLQTEMENVILNERLSEALSVSEYLSAHDSLTGLLNRRDFERVADELRGRNASQDMAIIVLDLDHFKKINDQFGHDVGDDVLRTAANLMQSQLRSFDVTAEKEDAIARWGGEEFIIAMANCSRDDIIVIAERIRFAFQDHENDTWPNGLTLSGSFGATCWVANEPLKTAINRADRAMYQAKASGRNQTKFAETKLLDA